MADFSTAYRITMQNEGGYADDPHDSGGETWRGIARNEHPQWTGWKYVDNIKSRRPAGQSLNEALKADTTLEGLVLDFYKKEFWDDLLLDEVRCQEIANQMFDCSVNMGQREATFFLQKSINKFTNNSLAVDGKAGSKTIAAVNNLPDEEVYNEINVLRAERYNEIIAKNHSKAEYRDSWFRRITPFQGTPDTMA